jgi:divalent metal cation (Fe/Co/Zn/Cd) transporter
LVGADPQRQRLIRRAFRLEWLSVGWMAVEAAVAIASGIAARSITLVAFGLDSVIELASAGVLIWRLSSELRFGREVSEVTERIAQRIAGGLLFALAAYVVVAAGWSLWHGGGEAFCWPGLAVALLSIPIMLVLARRKLALADQLGSRALRADAAEALHRRRGRPPRPTRLRRLVDRRRHLAHHRLVSRQGRARGLGERGGRLILPGSLTK